MIGEAKNITRIRWPKTISITRTPIVYTDLLIA
jgi:hypothetical protein